MNSVLCIVTVEIMRVLIFSELPLLSLPYADLEALCTVKVCRDPIVFWLYFMHF